MLKVTHVFYPFSLYATLYILLFLEELLIHDDSHIGNNMVYFIEVQISPFLPE